jgi:fluoride exporter
MEQEYLMPIQLYLTVALGGALGSVFRFAVSGLVAAGFGQTFPWGTLTVNMAGSFIIGFFATLTAPEGRLFVGGTTRHFVTTGFCGGFTTFSSFSLQTLNLMNDGEYLYAAGNVAGSVTLCMIFVWLGSVCAAMLNQLKGA